MHLVTLRPAHSAPAVRIENQARPFDTGGRVRYTIIVWAVARLGRGPGLSSSRGVPSMVILYHTVTFKSKVYRPGGPATVPRRHFPPISPHAFAT
jgi:hypothetical protein